MKRHSAAALIVLACSGCAGGQMTSQAPVSPARDLYADYVGKQRWVRSSAPLALWDGPPAKRGDSSGTGEAHLLTTGSFTIESQENTGYLAGFMVKFTDGRTGYVDIMNVIDTDDAQRHGKAVSAKADCDRRGGVQIGMSRAEVYASCWGKPNKINTTTGSYGTHEQLVYGASSYLYLENGVLRSIQTTGRPK